MSLNIPNTPVISVDIEKSYPIIPDFDSNVHKTADKILNSPYMAPVLFSSDNYGEVEYVLSYLSTLEPKLIGKKLHVFSSQYSFNPIYPLVSAIRLQTLFNEALEMYFGDIEFVLRASLDDVRITHSACERIKHILRSHEVRMTEIGCNDFISFLRTFLEYHEEDYLIDRFVLRMSRTTLKGERLLLAVGVSKGRICENIGEFRYSHLAEQHFLKLKEWRNIQTSGCVGWAKFYFEMDKRHEYFIK